MNDLCIVFPIVRRGHGGRGVRALDLKSRDLATVGSSQGSVKESRGTTVARGFHRVRPELANKVVKYSPSSTSFSQSICFNESSSQKEIKSLI